MKWRPSNISKPTPVKTCQSQVEVALGSCVKGFSIASASKYLQRRSSQHDGGQKHQGAEEGFFCLHAYVKARQRHTQAIETVNEHTGEQNDIECQEERRTRQRHERIPRAWPARQQAQHGQMQVQVDHQANAGNAIEGVCPHAQLALSHVEPSARAAYFGILESRHRYLLHIFLKRCAVSSRRSAIILPAGSTACGQASVHSKALWQRQTPWSPSASASKCAASCGSSVS